MSASVAEQSDRAVGAGRLGVRRGHRPTCGVDDCHRRADRAGRWDAGGGAWTRAGAIRPVRVGRRVRGRPRQSRDVGSPGNRSRVSPFDLTVTLDLEPIGPASTKASYGADIRLHGLWRLLSPMVAMEAKAGPARELSRLKAQVEAAPAMAPATS